MDDQINFSAKHGKWIAVKKMTIDEDTQRIDVARLLLSIRETLNNKIYAYLDEEFDLPKLEKEASGLVPQGRLSEDKIASILREVKSPKTTRMLKELTDNKNKLEIYKALYTELVLERLKLPQLNTKALDKYLNEKNRALK
ncbi:MAG: DUF2666 family protein [Candidatus Methanofastidiosia archaeon]